MDSSAKLLEKAINLLEFLFPSH